MIQRDGVESSGGIGAIRAREVKSPAQKLHDADPKSTSSIRPLFEDHDSAGVVAVVSSQTLTREALAMLMQTAGALTVLAAASARELLDNYAAVLSEVQVVILHMGARLLVEASASQDIATLREELPDAPLFLICDSEDPDHVREALRQGVRGYASTALTSQVLLSAIRLVKVGGTFVPVAPPEKSHNGRGIYPGEASNGDVTGDVLTVRQRQVLELLRQGKPNKVIARELELQESTVKIHVREIMRKLRVPNRTAAALLAISNPPDRKSVV